MQALVWILCAAAAATEPKPAFDAMAQAVVGSLGSGSHNVGVGVAADQDAEGQEVSQRAALQLVKALSAQPSIETASLVQIPGAGATADVAELAKRTGLAAVMTVSQDVSRRPSQWVSMTVVGPAGNVVAQLQLQVGPGPAAAAVVAGTAPPAPESSGNVTEQFKKRAWVHSAKWELFKGTVHRVKQDDELLTEDELTATDATFDKRVSNGRTYSQLSNIAAWVWAVPATLVAGASPFVLGLVGGIVLSRSPEESLILVGCCGGFALGTVLLVAHLGVLAVFDLAMRAAFGGPIDSDDYLASVTRHNLDLADELGADPADAELKKYFPSKKELARHKRQPSDRR